jgi:WD40 repeat protein/energy-coupling factor transporter ATP-binding protein EcfA2
MMKADMNNDENNPVAIQKQPGGVHANGNIYATNVAGRDIIITDEVAYDVRGLPNPYLGLHAFSYADRTAFAGREFSIRQAVEKLTLPGSQQTLIFITGASGSGKSSFAQAGLLPALETHYQERDKLVSRAVFRPSSDPLAMLADALVLLSLPELSSLELARFTPEEFTRFLAKHTPKNQVNLLVIDQFEELFTQSTAGQREVLFGFLAGLSSFAPIRMHIIVTLRSDFLEKLFNHQELWDIAKQGVELRSMSQEELKEAIQQPLQAACRGAGIGSNKPDERYCQKRFEASLLERLAEDAYPDATYLPLLQVTLRELWNGGNLTIGKYSSLTDAIRRRAEAVFGYEDYEVGQPEKERLPVDQNVILNIFLDLVDVALDDDYRRDVRRRRRKSELVGDSPQRQHLVSDLIQARLLSAGVETHDGNPVEMVDIIHESLINNWDRLREAIAMKRLILRRRARFEQQASEWLGSNCSDEYVLTGIRLAEARELEQEGDIALRDDNARAFLRKSLELAEAAQQRELERERARAEAERARADAELKRVRIARRALSGVSILLLIALIAVGAVVWQSNQLRNEKSISELRRVEAENANSTSDANRLISEARRVTAESANSTAEAERSISEAAKSTAVGERNRAEAQADISLARQLAAQAQEILLSQPNQLIRAGLISIESLKLYPEKGGNQALADALQLMPKLITRMTHDDDVYSVAFSPDGGWVASGSADGTARVWEAASGREVARMTHDVLVSSVAFSPDGGWVASGSGDGTARVWEAASGREVARMTHDGWVSSVAFSPDGGWVASGSWDGTARVWEAASGREVARMTHYGWVDSVAFSPDGGWVASVSRDGTARVWEAASGREVARMTHDDVVSSVAFSPDGGWVASGSEDDTARVWEAASGREVARMTHDDRVSSVAFSPDGGWVASGSEDGTARVWEAASGREVTRMTHDGVVSSVAFSPDGGGWPQAAVMALPGCGQRPAGEKWPA